MEIKERNKIMDFVMYLLAAALMGGSIVIFLQGLKIYLDI